MAHDPSTPSRAARWLAEIRGLIGLGLIVLGIHSLIAKPFYIPSESMMPGLLVGDHLVVSKYPYGWSYVSPAFHLLPFMKGRLLERLPERGDVVILTPPGGDRRGQDWIKRVVALPGDTVQLVDGRLWLNGRPVATRDLGERLLPIDGNLRCDAHNPASERAHPGYADTHVFGSDGRPACRVHVLRETLPNGRSYETLDLGPSGEDDFPAYTVPAGRIFLLGDNRDDSADSRVPVTWGGLGGAVPIENIGGRAEFLTFSLSGNATWDPRTWWTAFRASRSGTTLRPEMLAIPNSSRELNK